MFLQVMGFEMRQLKLIKYKHHLLLYFWKHNCDEHLKISQKKKLVNLRHIQVNMDLIKLILCLIVDI